MMDHSIADNYFKGYIDREEAVVRSSNPSKMEKILTKEGKATHQSAAVATASATSSKAAAEEEPAKPQKSGLFGKKK